MDDLVIASNPIKQIVKLKGHLQKRFSIKPIRDLGYVLGLKVKRDREHKKLKLSEETYAKRVLERFGMTGCHSTACLVTSNTTLEAQKGPAIDFFYPQAVGLVMYLAMDTSKPSV